MKQSDYQIQNACANCMLAYCQNHIDAVLVWYCRANLPEMPPDPEDVLFSEHHGDRIKDKMVVYRKAQKDFEEWAKDREVNPHGVCSRRKAVKWNEEKVEWEFNRD